jgi:hypothetical protein
MMLMPAIKYKTVMKFHWPELKAWHGIAIETYKAMKGIK